MENRDEAYPSTDVPTEITPSDGIQNEKASFRNYLKYSASDGELDSLPVKGDISDGSYNIKDSMHDLTIVVKDKAVVQFIMNGLDVPAAKIANFEKLIYKAFEKQKRYENLAIVDEDQGGSNNPVTTGSTDDQAVASVGIAEGDNTISSFSLSSNGKGFSFFTNGDQQSTAFGNRNAGDGTTLTMSTKGGYVYQFVKDKNKEVVRVSRNNTNLGTVEVKNGQYLIKGKEATTEQLKAMGLVKSGNGLNPTQGKFEVGTINIHGDEYDDNSDDTESFQDQLEELQARLECLSNKGYEEKKISRLERELNALESKIDDLEPNSGQEAKDKVQTQIDKIVGSMDELCYSSTNTYGSTGYNSGNNGNYYYNSNGGNDSNLKSLVGAELRRDKLMAEEVTYVSITSQNMMVNERVVSAKLLEKYKKICAKATGVPFEKSQYFAFSYNDYRSNGRSGISPIPPVPPIPPIPPVPGVNDETNGKIYRSLVKALLDENYFQLNKQTSFEMNEKTLRVNGKVVDEAKYNLIKSKLDKAIGKKRTWKIAFEGVVTKVTEKGVTLNGSLTQDFEN